AQVGVEAEGALRDRGVPAQVGLQDRQGQPGQRRSGGDQGGGGQQQRPRFGQAQGRARDGVEQKGGKEHVVHQLFRSLEKLGAEAETMQEQGSQGDQQEVGQDQRENGGHGASDIGGRAGLSCINRICII